MGEEDHNFQGKVLLEGMVAISNICGDLPAWRNRPDGEKLAAIQAIATALQNFDLHSDVTRGLAQEKLARLGQTAPEIVAMLPAASSWLEQSAPD